MKQFDSGGGSEKILLVLLESKTCITPTWMIPILQRESSNKRRSSWIAKSWTMESIQPGNGAIWLVSTKERTMLSAAICNCSWSRRDSNKYLKGLQLPSLICQSLTPMTTRTPCSASVRKRSMRTLKSFTLWRLVLQHPTNRNSRNLLISKCNKMETSQFWSKTARNSALFSLLRNSDFCICMRSRPPVSCTDRKSLINFASSQPETPTPMEWLWSTEEVKSLLLMLKRTIWFLTSIQQATSQITKLFPLRWLSDSICLEPMKCSNNCSLRKSLHQIMLVPPTLPETHQEHFWEIKIPLTFSRTFLKLVVLHQSWFTSMHSYKRQNLMQLNP